MANGFSTYMSQAIINNSLVTPTFPLTKTMYLSLHTSDPTDDNDTATEVGGAWYARQATGAWASAVGTGNSTSNSAQIQFPAVTGSAVTVTHWAIYDALAATTGNMLYSGALSSSKLLNVADVLTVAIGALVITVD